MARLASIGLVLALGLAGPACRVTADYAGSSFRCDDGVCPTGYGCVAGRCEVTGTTTSDAAVTIDGATADAAPVGVDLRSCKSILETGGSLGDGVYTLDRDNQGPQPSFTAYCDMTVAGGGWTLVGRSVFAAATGGNFGWRHAAGDVLDDSQPYAIDANRLTKFSTLLVGSYTVGKQWGTVAYTMMLPPGFLGASKASATAAVAMTVLGICAPPGGPTMLRFVGFTDDADKFFLRDNNLDSVYGLGPAGFDLAYVDCDRAAGLEGAQGMIFVR